MKYFVVSDTHSFFDETMLALTEAGYFSYTGEKKIIICGDLLDRGPKPLEMVEFTAKLMKSNDLIFIKGNHEDLFMDFYYNYTKYALYGSYPYHHMTNGTYNTFMALANINTNEYYDYKTILDSVKENDFFKFIIPNSLDYFETNNYVFTHGWLPTVYNEELNHDVIAPNWKDASKTMWESARWSNGMLYAHLGAILEKKIIVCGHYHTSYGHHHYENDGPEFATNANFTPYKAKGIIAIDACTAYSKKVNCLVIDD